MTNVFRPSALFIALVLTIQTASAQFTGNFALTPPSAGSYSANTSLGSWTFTNTSTGGSASVDTTNTPGSLQLTSSGFGLGLTGTSNFAYGNFLQSGNLSIDYNYTASNGGGGASTSFAFEHNNIIVQNFISSASGTFLLNVTAGDSMSFVTAGSGGMFMITFPFPMFFPTSGSSSVALSNLSFTPSSVPEPADAGLLLGAAALGWVAYRRRQRA